MSHSHHHGHNHDDFSAVIATFSVERQPGSRVVIKGEIPVAELAKHESHVLQELGQDVEIKGFRKGHVPESMLRKHIGEMALFTEVCEHTLSHMYPAILDQHKLDAIGRPTMHAEKVVPGNPFGFRIEISVMPDVVLPDYTAIAKKMNTTKEDGAVTEKDVEDAIERILRQKLSYDRLQEKARARAVAEEAKKQAAKDGLTLPTPETAVGETDDTPEDVASLPLPTLTDEYVKTLGAFESVAAFTAQVKEHLEVEKKNELMSKHRGALTDAIVEKMTVDLPHVLIQSELSQMFGQMEEDLARAGLTIDGYLAHMQKTREDLEKEWTPTAEKRAKVQLALNEIAKKESIEPDVDEIEKQAAPLLEQYKDADPLRVRLYVASVLQNDAVMKFLESAS